MGRSPATSRGLWCRGILVLTVLGQLQLSVALSRVGILEALTNAGKPASTDYPAMHGAVVLDKGVARFVAAAQVQGAAASGSFIDAAHTTSNFGQLRVSTSAEASDADQMFAAGYLEGWLTAERIYDYFYNTHHYFTHQLTNQSLVEPIDWLEEQDAWVRRQVRERGHDSYWQVLGLILRQFDGLVQGYQDRQAAEADPARIPPLSRRDFLFVNGNGELYDVLAALAPAARPDWAAMSGRQMATKLATSGHCSALIKVTGDLGELLMGHSTWDTYSSLVRIYKHYQFSLAHADHAMTRLSFSSYPGELFSDDDLYLMDTQLVVLSTTNEILNDELYSLLHPHTVVSWQRVRVAHAMATSGRQWADTFRRHNSGTYNNQYMVLDLKKFQQGQELQPDLLWVVEQIPGLVEAADMTPALELGYWPSYNVPFFPEVYKRSGFAAMHAEQQARGGDFLLAAAWLSYQLAPRAKIFRRDSGRVEDLESLKSLLRYNDWTHDQYADGSPLGQVCGRGDLDPHTPSPHGCYDTKVTSYSLAANMEAEVVAGPTTQGGLPPFQWAEQFSDVVHRGQPQVFDFAFELQSPHLGAGGAQAQSTS